MSSVGPVPMPVVLMLLAFVVAASVGRLAAPKSLPGPWGIVAGTFFDMLAIGLIVGRVAFVLQWLPLYVADPWALLRFGDGGYVLWAAVPAGLAFGAWRAWRRPELRRPVLWGSVAGLVSWMALAGALVLMQRSAVQLPTAELSRLEGGSVRLSDLTGKPMVVNLWATWCPPCRREMPVLADAQAAHVDTRFVFVNQGESEQTIREYLSASNLWLHNVVLDPFSDVSRAARARGMPTTLFFDREGKLIDVHMGELSRAGLAQMLERIDSAPAQAQAHPGGAQAAKPRTMSMNAAGASTGNSSPAPATTRVSRFMMPAAFRPLR